MRVRVREDLQEQFVGFYDHARRRPGDVFDVPDEPRRILFPAEKKLTDENRDAKAVYQRIKDKDGKVPQTFSFRWMEPVEDTMPLSHTTSQQALDHKSEMLKAEKAAAVPANVI